MSDFIKKFQVASIHDTNEYQIWWFCCNLSYADNKDTHTHRHTDQTLKMWFLDSGVLKTCKSMKISISKIWPKNNAFSTITWIRESKNKHLDVELIIRQKNSWISAFNDAIFKNKNRIFYFFIWMQLLEAYDVKCVFYFLNNTYQFIHTH